MTGGRRINLQYPWGAGQGFDLVYHDFFKYYTDGNDGDDIMVSRSLNGDQFSDLLNRGNGIFCSV